MSKIKQQQRTLIIQEAARLMFNEGVKQFLDAKKMAAKRLFGKQLKYLPSNGEISAELHRISQLQKGDCQERKLYEMRMRALEIMTDLQPFSPRLIGSVSSGRIRDGSDIDLHLFVDDIEELCNYIDNLGWRYEQEQVTIQQQGRRRDYTHLYLNFDFPVELSVYPAIDIRTRTRSSTDGKPIDRLSCSRLRQLIVDQHWQLHLKSGF